ncbi:MAG TPA: hybrid sensor histidine kinase/response regulator [Rhodocyclaceae bacterium]|nr:hybrid sensor histidine kinase/response regulator [Rhodocyclaceae bacterium]
MTGDSVAANEKPLILLVDDMPINLMLLASALKPHYRIKTAVSGRAGIELARQADRPQLILLDVMMPEMSGIEVLQTLRQDIKTRDIPVIFVSADTSEQSQLSGFELGADDYLAKPVVTNVLLARVRNILRRKQAEDHVRELNETLERRVEQRSMALEATMLSLRRSQEELVRSEAKATLSTLIASISHELHTPLGNSVIMTNTMVDNIGSFRHRVESGQLRRSELLSFLTTLAEGEELLQRNLQRAQDLLGKFKQVAADQASEQRRRFDLATTVREILQTIAPSLKAKPYRIVQDIPAELEVDGYPGALGQVLINLVNNAWLHAFEGRDRGTLTIQAALENDHIRIRVADDGVGMAPEISSRLFQPFFSTKIGHGGTGLGMTIVENLVTKSLAGRLEVESIPGKGTRFDIRIPKIAPCTPPSIK